MTLLCLASPTDKQAGFYGTLHWVSFPTASKPVSFKGVKKQAKEIII